jgi:hypothetical protein
VASDVSAFSFISLQMAFELYGMLAGNVSPTTGENVKPAYGGAEEAFLKLVVTPIYKIIEMVRFLHFHFKPSLSISFKHIQLISLGIST